MLWHGMSAGHRSHSIIVLNYLKPSVGLAGALKLDFCCFFGPERQDRGGHSGHLAITFLRSRHLSRQGVRVNSRPQQTEASK